MAKVVRVSYLGHMTETMPLGTVPSWTLADRLRKARESVGLDQQELADAMGVSRNSISNYEHGRHAPRLIVIRAWAQATNVPVEWLIKGPGDDVTSWLLPPLALAG